MMMLPEQSAFAESQPLPHRIYARPPVVEAVVEIRVSPRPDLRVPELASVLFGEETEYSQPQQLFAAEFTIDAASATITERKEAIQGYRFAGSSTPSLVQIGLERFAFSRLAPYKPWSSWCEEARRLWSKYLDHTSPNEVTRIAVRYVNRIEFAPSDDRKILDYIKVYPELPPELPNRLAGLLMRLDLRSPQLPGVGLVVNVGRTDPSVAGHVALLLDLDLSRDVQLPSDDSTIWSIVEELHDLENSFFESCITDLSRELFS